MVMVMICILFRYIKTDQTHTYALSLYLSTYSHLSTCFNHTLPVERHLTRYKHWFQDSSAMQHRQRHDTLVVAQFRDPYDWLEAMRDHPHHSPEHLYLDWPDFLSKPWTMKRIGRDLEISNSTARCQQDFSYNEIVSCSREPLPIDSYESIHMSRHQPFYELKQDGSGEPFENIMEMRAAKIRNFLDTKEYPKVVDAWPVQYEYLLARGTKRMLDKISKVTGVPYKCDPYPTQHRKQRTLSKQFVEYVNEHMDWTAEELIGYHRREEDTVDDDDEKFVLSKNEMWKYFSNQEIVDE